MSGSRLEVTDRASLDAACLAVLSATRHQLVVYMPVLETGQLDSDEMTDALRRIATGGRYAGIRILTHDAARALRDSHRLIVLCQRLPSSVQLRVPREPRDLGYASAFLLNDAGGFLFRPDARRIDARADLDAPAERAPLQGYFDEVWERSLPAAEIRPLGV